MVVSFQKILIHNWSKKTNNCIYYFLYFNSSDHDLFQMTEFTLQVRKEARANVKMKAKAKAKPKGRPKRKAKAKPKAKMVAVQSLDDDDDDDDDDDEDQLDDQNGDGGQATDVPSIAADVTSTGVSHEIEDDMKEPMPAANEGTFQAESYERIDLGVQQDLPHGDPPDHVVSLDIQQEPAQPSSAREVGPKVHATPFEIMAMMRPSRHFQMMLDENPHRFKVECRLKEDFSFDPPYQYKTFSKSFLNYPWQDALKECHQYMWEKWKLVSHLSPLELDEQQTPGVVSKEVLDLMESKINNLEPAKKYLKKMNELQMFVLVMEML